jgi:site-specific DNA-methyltransferase (adenine-specific)
MNLPLNSIIHGDCINVLSQFPGDSVDLIFADPPYNLQLSQDLIRPNQSKVDGVDDVWDKFKSFEEYDTFCFQWLSECRRVLNVHGTLWVIGSYHNIYRIGKLLQDLGFWILNDVIWVKDNPMPNFRGVRFTNAHETILWVQKTRGAKYTFNHHSMKALNDDLQMRSDWYLPLCSGGERQKYLGKKAHSTQKPEALLYRILLSSTHPGDVVLDPFFGTGTTGAVAKKLGRNYIGIERDSEYIDIARKRIEMIMPAPDVSLNIQEPRNRARIPIGALLEAGYLLPGQILTFSQNHAIKAIILANGKILCNDLTGSIHSVAKQLSENQPINGWDSWLCEFDGQFLKLDDLRQKFRNRIAEHHENQA